MIAGLSTAKLIGGVIALLIVAVLFADRARFMHRAHVAEAQAAADCDATRLASGLKKLRCDETDEQIAFLGQALAAVKAKTAEAKALDVVNKARVEGEQATINQERGSSYETRIADARARAERVRPTARGADSRRGGTAPVSGLPAAAGQSAEAASQDGLSAGDALTATEQAIQLDELIKWVKAQHAVDVNGAQPHR